MIGQIIDQTFAEIQQQLQVVTVQLEQQPQQFAAQLEDHQQQIAAQMDAHQQQFAAQLAENQQLLVAQIAQQQQQMQEALLVMINNGQQQVQQQLAGIPGLTTAQRNELLRNLNRLRRNGNLFPLVNLLGIAPPNFPPTIYAFSTLTVVQLRHLLQFYGQPHQGNREALLTRFGVFIGI
mmetsp:Transcript_6991/g.10383  ORF Transcript_6991/g.10383 Transcript_6991/m.10383 type:complete len:179 (-) Transcript_6991:159-695(-)